MTDPKILTVIIGIIGALLGVYFREMLREAIQRKKIAAQLEAYLDDWRTDILENEDLAIIMGAASAWNSKEVKALQKSNNTFFEARDEYKVKLKELKNVMQEKKSGEGIYREIRSLSIFEIDQRLSGLREAREGLLKNITMISDDDAALLSWIAVKRIVIIRNNALHILSKLINLIEFIQKHTGEENQVIKRSSSELFEITKSMIEVMKNMEPLHKYATNIRSSNIFSLMIH